MKRIIFIFLLGCYGLQAPAQLKEVKKPSTLLFHVFYNDFNSAQLMRSTSIKNMLNTGQWYKIEAMQMGFGFNYMKGINKKIDLITTLDGSSTDYLFQNGSTNGTSKFLLDAHAGLNIKLFADDHVLVPYFSAGAGFSSYKGKTGFYIPAGAGLQFNLFNEAFVLAGIQYRRALTVSTVNDHFYYSLGIGTSIGKKKIKPAKVEEVTAIQELVKKEIIIPSRDIIITVRDEATGQSLAFVDVMVTGLEGKKLSALTDADGRVIFNTLTPADYIITGLLNNISTSVQNIKKANFETNDNQINITITHNDPRYTLSGIVINKTKNIPEGGVNVNITNQTKHSTLTKQSNVADGIFNVQLEAGSDFTLFGKKADYISNIEKISTKGLNRSTTLYVKLELGIEEAKAGQSIVLNNIYFEPGKTDVNPAFSTDLDKVVQFLTDNAKTRLEIQGHTDNTGNMALNNKLSQARANSLVTYLTKNGIDSSRLTAIGFGQSLPVASNVTTEGRAKNRRVVMRVLQ